jgi:DNA repair protein RAD57
LARLIPVYSASGKSHLGLQLCVAGQLPTSSAELLPSGAILLTSERKVSFSRLEELARHIDTQTDPKAAKLAAKTLLDNVHTLHITEVDGLDHALAYIIPAMISRISAKSGRDGSLPIRLLVIDSIGALFRSSFETGFSGLTQRSRMLCLIADKLKLLAETQNMAIVVINQVTDVFQFSSGPSNVPSRPESPSPVITHQSGSTVQDGSNNTLEEPTPTDVPDQPTMTYKRQSRYFSGQSQSYPKEASLGLVWANAVNVRIMLSRTGRRRLLDPEDLGRKRVRLAAYDREVQHEQGVVSEDTFEPTLIRRMHLVFSPFARQDMLDYAILQSGIHSVPERRRIANEDVGDGPVLQSNRSNTNDQEAAGSSESFQDDLIFDDFTNLPPDFWEEPKVPP